MKSRYAPTETSPNSLPFGNTLGYIDNARNSKDSVGTIKSDFDTHFRSTLHTLTDPVLRAVDKTLPDDFHGVLTDGQKVLASARDNLTSKTSFIANKFNYFLSTLPQSAQLSALLDYDEAKLNDWNKMRHSVEKLPEVIQETKAALRDVQEQEQAKPPVGFFAFIAGFFIAPGKQQVQQPVVPATKPQQRVTSAVAAVPQAPQQLQEEALADALLHAAGNIDLAKFKKLASHVEEVRHSHPPAANHAADIQQTKKQANTGHSHW